MDYINLIIAVAAIVSAGAAVGALRNSIKIQEKTADENKKNNTIEAFNRLQDQVLDKMVSFSEEQIDILIEDMDYEPEIKEAYDDCRALVAKCEHFAVGVNSGVYDIDLVNALGGVHLIYLYRKVLPIIEQARGYENSKDAYKEFEKLVNSLSEMRGTI